MLSTIYKDDNDLENALELCEKAINLSEKESLYFRTKAEILLELEKIEEAKAERDNKTEKLNSAKEKFQTAQAYYYGTFALKDDYYEKSAYKSTANGEEVRVDPSFGVQGYADPMHERINRTEDYEKLREYFPTIDPEVDKHLDEMSKDEINLYNYLYNTQGKESAEKYISYIQDDLYRRYGKTIAERIDNDFEKVLFSAKSSWDKAAADIADLTSGNNTPTNATQYAGQIVREDLNGFGKFAYDALGAAT